MQQGHRGWGQERHALGDDPFKRTVKMPYRRPDSCTVSADAQLGTGGKLHVWIIAWKR